MVFFFRENFKDAKNGALTGDAQMGPLEVELANFVLASVQPFPKSVLQNFKLRLGCERGPGWIYIKNHLRCFLIKKLYLPPTETRKCFENMRR